MTDLQQIVKTTFGQGNPTPDFYVSVDDAKKLLEEIKERDAEIESLAADRDMWKKRKELCFAEIVQLCSEIVRLKQ